VNGRTSQGLIGGNRSTHPVVLPFTKCARSTISWAIDYSKKGLARPTASKSQFKAEQLAGVVDRREERRKSKYLSEGPLFTAASFFVFDH
jgi:hypothetical protein